ncbi:hypothetical protein [Allofournierella massiliensis]|uniref:hypothetical protein n=1 Tax=Allofournierella massiliensis TaxID=1650663 RepID=UPI0024B05E88|nr:hypothetical protein [Fournierella massiliensis]
MADQSTRGKLRQIVERWHCDYSFQTMVGACVSFCVTLLFAFYHGYLGLCFSSAWHKNIGIFYLLLTAIRGCVLLSEKRNTSRPEEMRRVCRQRVFLISSLMLLLLDLSLITPIVLMALLAKPTNIGIHPAIAMATYTTYKIITASLHIHKQKRAPHQNLLISELRVINFIDALVSVLTLQSTLILVNQESPDISSMLPLTASSSAVIYSIIVITTLYMLRNGLAESKGNTT